MPNWVKVHAPGKVNLALKVGAIGSDGFHPVESVYQAVDLYDEIIATHSQRLELEMKGAGAKAAGTGSTNLAWRAAEALAKLAGIEPRVHLEIHKRIPIAGGMAGGSADAAGALVACDALWNLQTPRAQLLEIAASLGSDIPFSVVGGTELGKGRGDVLTTLLARGEFHWVFALSSEGLSTPAVYREFDRLNPEPAEPVVAPELIHALTAGDVQSAAKFLDNDLQEAALSLQPRLRRVLAAGREAGALAGIVSGSGPTCAFLAKSADHALDLAVELQAGGLVKRTVKASGPVRGAQVVEFED